MKKTAAQTPRRVGFWYSKFEPHLPKPVATPHKPTEVFLRQLDLVETAAREIAYRGWSTCRICGQKNGSTSFVFQGFEWPNGYGHYFEAHGVQPEPDFKKMVLSYSSEAEPNVEQDDE